MVYLFYPFGPAENDATASATLQGLGRAFSAAVTPPIAGDVNIWRDDDTYPADLTNAAAGDTVYIIGHTARGMKVIGDANGNTYDQTWIVEKLESYNLGIGQNVEVVMYACWSGVGGEECLASRVASALNIRTPTRFVSADNVWGYTKKVSMKAVKDGSGGRSLGVYAGGKYQPEEWYYGSRIRCDPTDYS